MIDIEEDNKMWKRSREKFGNSDINLFLKEMVGEDSSSFLCKEMGDWIRLCFGDFAGKQRGDNRKIIRMLQVYRGAGKTGVVTTLGIMWLLLIRPDISIGLYSAGIDLASDILNDIGRRMKSENYIDLFNDIYKKNLLEIFTQDKKQVKTLNIDFLKKEGKEPTITALGLGSGDTGKHYDLIICDDIVSATQSLSQADRHFCEERVTDMFGNVLSPGGAMVFVGTPHHPDDIYSIIDHKFSKKESKTDYFFKKYPLGSLSKDTPERVEMLTDQAMTMGGINFLKRHYNLELLANEIHEPFANIQCGEFEGNRNIYNISKIVASIDPAYSGANSTAVVILFKTVTSDRIYFLGKLWDKSSLTIAPNIVEFLSGYNVSRVFVEANKDEGYLTNILRDEYREIDKTAIITPIKNTSTKTTRIYSSIVPRLKELYMLTDECSTDFVRQIKRWTEETPYDDAPDALALGISQGFPKTSSKGSALGRYIRTNFFY